MLGHGKTCKGRTCYTASFRRGRHFHKHLYLVEVRLNWGRHEHSSNALHWFFRQTACIEFRAVSSKQPLASLWRSTLHEIVGLCWYFRLGEAHALLTPVKLHIELPHEDISQDPVVFCCLGCMQANNTPVS